MTKINSNKKGFTIIEVVLVLAIAGLIFMMVFIALPALQRSQRDTQRSNDVARVQTALNNYQANNRGAIPSSGEYITGHDTPEKSVTTGGTKTWLYFYDNYLIVNSAGSQDVFADPDGGYYSLWIVDCLAKNESGTTDKSTNKQCDNGQRHNVTFDEQALGTIEGESNAEVSNKNSVNSDGSTPEKGHSISIIKNATCQGEVAYYSTGARKVAIVYKKEGGGTFCLNN